MNILGIDTSTKTLAIAVIKKGVTVAAYNYKRQMRHSKNIVRCLDHVLQKARMRIHHIDHIACGVGPGSYTGLRIGHAFVKGLALPANIPVFPFSSLELIAYNIKPKHDSICVLINARRGKVYCGIFERFGEGLRQRRNDTLLDIAEVTTLIKRSSGLAVTGDALDACADQLEPYVATKDHLYSSQYWYAKAENIARILNAHKTLRCIHSEQLVPEYLRISEAEEKFGRVM